MAAIKMKILEEEFSVCKLPPGSKVPEWALKPNEFSTVSRTDKELSLTVLSKNVPKKFVGDNNSGWKCLEVEGPLDFSLTGILSQIVLPLAESKVSIFAISTFDTDYVMVKEELLEKAREALAGQGISTSRK